MKRALVFSSLLCVLLPVSLLAQASVTLSPSSYNFGSTAVGTGTAWVTFTLPNSGSSAVSISNVTVSGPFVVSSNCVSSVAANGSCPIYVYFYPTSAGAASGALTVTDNATNSPQTSSLSGTGGSGASCTTTPGAPTGLAASGTTSSSTNLSWTADTAPANCTISSYRVIENGTSIGTATGTTFAVTGLSASTAYGFTVEATDSNGTSGPSSAVNVTTLANACTTKPSAPTGLAASGTSSSGTNLSWTADTPPSGCTISSYTVLQNGTSIGTRTGTTFAVTGLTASTAYSFTVEATDSAGTSAASSAINVTTSASSCTTKPSAPTGFAASGTTDTTSNLSWNAVTPPSGCTITNYTVLQNGSAIGTATSTSYTPANLSPSTSYSFTVEATDYAGTSSASVALSV